MGISRQHLHGRGGVAAHGKFQHLIAVHTALLDQGTARHHNEKLPLGVVPVLALGDAGFRDIHAELTAVLGLEQFGKAAAGIHVHF